MRPGINKAKTMSRVESMAVDCGKVYSQTLFESDSNWYMRFNVGQGSWGVRTGWMTVPKGNMETGGFELVRINLNTKVSDIDKMGIDANVEVPKRILNTERR